MFVYLYCANPLLLLDVVKALLTRGYIQCRVASQ